MDAFSYLSVLLAIIVGLGMTQVLTASGRLSRHRDRVRTYWPPLVWAGLLLVVYVQAWWAMFGLRTHTDWNFLTFFVVLLQTVMLYIFFSSRRRHTRFDCDWSSDVCSSD